MDAEGGRGYFGEGVLPLDDAAEPILPFSAKLNSYQRNPGLLQRPSTEAYLFRRDESLHPKTRAS